MDGVFLINKQVGWTSFDVCAKLRKKFDTKRVGHTGTLDPFADGLMIVTMGKATKIIPFLEDLDKEYVAKLKLGTATDTLDLTGNIIEEKEVPSLTREQIIEVLESFKGNIKQVPPMYSALKHNGVALYQLARDGIEIERKERDVTIKNIQLIDYKDNVITFSAFVSKGTYIRTLGEDIAKKLNTVGHLVELKRTKIGRFDLTQAKTIDEIAINDVIGIERMLPHMDNIYVTDEEEVKIRNGMKLRFNANTNLIFLKNKKEEALAIYEKRDQYYYCKRGLFECK